MPLPVTTIKANFLYFDSIKEPTEMMAKAILFKKVSVKSTPVVLALYTRGFYVKGKMNHISYDETKSRPNQFVSAGLLRDVFKLQIKDELVLVIFHETIEVKTEAMLFSFSNNSFHCSNFHEYLTTLKQERFCSESLLNTLFVKSIALSSTSNKTFDHNNSGSDTGSKSKGITEKLQSSLERREAKIKRSIQTPDSISINDTVSESICPTVSSKTEQIFESSKLMVKSKEYSDDDTIDIKTDLSLDTTYSIKSITEDFEEYELVSETDTETDLRCDSSHSKTNTVTNKGVITNIGSKTFPSLNLSDFFAKPVEMSDESDEQYNDTSLFCWPEYLIKEYHFTSSILVEMYSLRKNKSSNWSLLDKYFRKGSIYNEQDIEWDERVHRLHYDPIKKRFKKDRDGSLLLYCCRQISVSE